MDLPVVTPENYYSPEMNMAYMGSTQFKAFEKCEAAALAELRGEYTPPTSQAFLVGGYIDAWFSGELPLYQAQHPEIFKRDGIRCIREALEISPYIKTVHQISVQFEGSVLHLSFKAKTIYGEVTLNDGKIAL